MSTNTVGSPIVSYSHDGKQIEYTTFDMLPEAVKNDVLSRINATGNWTLQDVIIPFDKTKTPNVKPQSNVSDTNTVTDNSTVGLEAHQNSFADKSKNIGSEDL